ncbi:MAG TPA: hypothetical protein VJT50_09825 [Pyrinomonadaceae bacterium]|nr:hypothetical protein [Pyrinomonadaceae bacterium]
MSTPRSLKNTTPEKPETATAYAARVQAQLKSAWLPLIYRDRIRKIRTRAYDFEEIKPRAKVEIQHTLLGVELKVGKRRLLCPDLATARYLSVFARAGCKRVAVPYDITKTSQLADELESAWHRTFLLADHLAAGKSESFRKRLHRELLTYIRNQIDAAGAGPAVPEFKQNTKQRR